MKHKCKDCAHFVSTLKTQGCGLNYPVAKCSGNLEIECEDFISPEAEKTRQEKLFSKLPIIETPATDELIELIESINLPMNLADIKIGENYKMIKADTDFDEKFIFIKKDSVVQVLDKNSGSDLDVLVQDLSKRKTADGVWWISHECLERIDDIIKTVGTTTAFDESVAHTNRGKLNGMSNEELAEMLVSFFTNKDGNSRYTFCNLDCEYKDYDDAIIACMKWLKSESDQEVAKCLKVGACLPLQF